jgi:hypothetical protein
MLHTVNDYKAYLSELSRRLVAAGVEARILLFGGGALAFEHNARDATKDLDVLLFEPGAGYAKLFSSEISGIYGIENDWINDDGSRFVTEEIKAAAKVFWRLPGLTILTPPLDALLAMKILSMRIGPQHSDSSDIVFLIKKLGLVDVEDALSLVDKYLPSFKKDIDEYRIEMLANLIELAREHPG